MTQTSGFFDPGGYDRATIAQAFGRYLGNGYVPGYLNRLAVTQHTAPNMSVNIDTGGSIIEGYWHDNDASVNLTIDAADPSNPRIDLIVARLTTTGSPGSIELAVHKGTAATPAVAPSRTWASPIYEIVLAYVSVAAGTTAITTAMITDKRGDQTLCGAARPYAVGKNAYWDVIMNGYKLTGCANPSAAGDGDTKGARDAAILVAVPSQAGNTGKFLTTNGSATSWAAQAAFFLASASDTLVTSNDTAVTIVATSYALMKSQNTPIVHLAGGVYRVKFSLLAPGIATKHVYGKIYVNGIAVGTERHLQGSVSGPQTVEYSEDITITAAGGAAIQIYCYQSGAVEVGQLLNFRIYCTEAIPW